MKKLMMMLALGTFCLTASANVGFWQDTTKTKQDTTKKHHGKKSHDKKKDKDKSKQDTTKRDTTTRPPQK